MPIISSSLRWLAFTFFFVNVTASATQVSLYLEPNLGSSPVVTLDWGDERLQPGGLVPDENQARDGWMWGDYQGEFFGYIDDGDLGGKLLPVPGARVRLRPSAKSPVLATIREDDSFEIVDTVLGEGIWLEIQFESTLPVYFQLPEGVELKEAELSTQSSSAQDAYGQEPGDEVFAADVVTQEFPEDQEITVSSDLLAPGTQAEIEPPEGFRDVAPTARDKMPEEPLDVSLEFDGDATEQILIDETALKETIEASPAKPEETDSKQASADSADEPEEADLESPWGTPEDGLAQGTNDLRAGNLGSSYAEFYKPSSPPTAIELQQTHVGVLQRAEKRFLMFSPPFPYELVLEDGERKAWLDVSQIAAQKPLNEYVGKMVVVYGIQEMDSPKERAIIRGRILQLK